MTDSISKKVHGEDAPKFAHALTHVLTRDGDVTHNMANLPPGKKRILQL